MEKIIKKFLLIPIFTLCCVFGLAGCGNKVTLSSEEQHAPSAALYDELVQEFQRLDEFNVAFYSTENFFEHYSGQKKYFSPALESVYLIKLTDSDEYGVHLFLFNNAVNANRYYQIVPSGNQKRIYYSIVLETIVENDVWTSVLNVYQAYLSAI